MVSALALARNVLARRSIEPVSLFQPLESETVKQAASGETVGREHRSVSPETLRETVAETSKQPPIVSRWMAGLERLLAITPPVATSPAAWRSRLAAGVAFARDWGAVAHGLGWNCGELFALHPVAPLNRFDAMGAAFLTSGKAVVAITSESITVRAGGAIQRIHKADQPMTPGWEAFGSGPAVNPC